MIKDKLGCSQEDEDSGIGWQRGRETFRKV